MNTIVALATSAGRSAIGVLRLSGPEALTILKSLTELETDPEPSKVFLKPIKNAGNNRTLDHALITFFKAPHSYTGEDLVEISCHGSPIILRQVLDTTLRLGARLAGPGEFTLRAVGNGKINLSQAEAIRDLINARTTAAAQQAIRQVSGELSNTLQPMKDQLLNLIVLLESSLEFAEDDLPEVQNTEVLEQLAELIRDLEKLSSTYDVGHLLSHGLRVTIAGRPNVGKSSLFNSLLRSDRAIVTAIPGTTRDTIREEVSVDGIPIVLTDTAGLRHAGDHVETIGVERTHRAMADSDLLLVVIDGTQKLHEDDLKLLDQAKSTKSVVVVNKSDAPQFNNPLSIKSGVNAVVASALTGAGLDNVRAAILAPFGSVDSDDVGLLVTNARHHDLLKRTVQALNDSSELVVQKASEELVLVGMHNALKFLGEITGETTTEDILTRIFSTFCIGK